MNKLITFSELIKFSVGTNPTRIKETALDEEIYTLEDFDKDLCSLSGTEVLMRETDITKKNAIVVNESDVIFSLTRNKAGIVSAANSGKYLTSNFIKCEFDSSKLYPWYFCYLMNESPKINQQIQKSQQGTIVSINRLTVGMIGALQFELEDYSTQKSIGDIYKNLLLREYLAKKQIEEMKKYALALISKVDKN